MRIFGLGTLGQHLARQNVFYILICLAGGTSIYLLSDLFDRLDDFVDAGLGLSAMLYYFAIKIPVIFSQILPAVFLLSVIIQLGIMNRSREITALQAGGISRNWFVKFFVIYAILWSCFQLVFAQYIGVYGEQEAGRVWKEDVRQKQLDEIPLTNLWFRDGPYTVHANTAVPALSRAMGITVYEFELDSHRLIRIISAQKALVDEHGWGLVEAQELDTRNFASIHRKTQFLPIRQSLKAFREAEDSSQYGKLPIWELSSLISQLEISGSNVEGLKTIWHSKLSYAFAIVTMALLALAVTSFLSNVYAGIGVSLMLIFGYYALYIVGISAGQKGLLPPMAAAWLANGVFSVMAGLRLLWVGNPAFERTVRACSKLFKQPQKAT